MIAPLDPSEHMRSEYYSVQRLPKSKTTCVGGRQEKSHFPSNLLSRNMGLQTSSMDRTRLPYRRRPHGNGTLRIRRSPGPVVSSVCERFLTAVCIVLVSRPPDELGINVP